jgi:hypothetical protein
MGINFFPSITFNKFKPNFLLIVVNDIFSTNGGGEITQNFYYKSLKEIGNVDVISIMGLNFPDFQPQYFTSSPESFILGDFFIAFEPLKERKFLYNLINLKKYDHIFTRFSISRSSINYSTKITKIFFDTHSKLIQETPFLKHYKPMLEYLENNEFSLYDNVVTCSALDAKNNPKLKYIPFSSPPQLQTYYLNPKSPKLIVIGGGNWFRFYNLYNFLSVNKNKIKAKIDIYCPNTDFDTLKKDTDFTHFDDNLNLPPLDNYSYSIMPIEYNSGISTKILTSLSYGLPVITTANVKENMFKEHRHVYSFNNFEEINSLLELNVRQDPKIYLEIKEDLNAFNSKQVCIEEFSKILQK